MAQANLILNQLCCLERTNFEVRDVKVKADKVVWQIEHKEETVFECPRCGNKLGCAHDWKWIRLWDYPFGNKKCEWRIKRARILCSCSPTSVRVEKLSFRSKHHHLTQRFVDYIEEVLCSKMFTVADVARLFELDYGTIYKIDHEVLLRLIQKMEIPDPIHIAVDEKSFQKRHSYVTLITDTSTKDVIWVSKGNSKESLDEFFKVLGKERCLKIQTVSKDLHKPYALSCKEYIPDALEVADPFHVIKRLNQALDESRKELSIGSQLKVSKRKTIHNMQWVLRYKKKNMKSSHIESLKNLEKINKPLYQAYLLKEKFFKFFNFTPKQVAQARLFLIDWIVESTFIKLKGLEEFGDYIMRNTIVLLNIIKTRRNSAISEGINRKVTVIKSMAYGYRNIQYFMLKILQRCGVLGSLWTPEVKLTT